MNLLTKISSLFGGQKRLSIARETSFFRFLGTTWRGSGTYSGDKLSDLYRRNELAYACISKIAEVMNDAELIVERQNNKGEWEKIPGHPLAALMKKPNGQEIGLDFRKKWTQSEYSLGIVYIHLVRPRPNAVPTEFYVLNPNRVMPQIVYNGGGRIDHFQYTTPLGDIMRIAPENMIIRRRADLTDEYGGLAPLQVAANTIEGDENLTDYINSFFDGDDGNAGVPAGILKFNRTLGAEQAEQKRKLWNKNTRGNEVQVLDDNADYIPVASKINELSTDTLTARNEAKILGIFGVPASLVSAYVGYLHMTQNATVKTAMKDFYLNKISPELKSQREWLTWFLLPEFEDINLIKAEKIRVGWDLSQMLALQEDLDAMHDRERKNFQAGGITLNEYRAAIGKMPDTKGDYYLQPFNLSAISPENRAAEAVRKVEAGTDPDEAGNSIPTEDEEKSNVQILHNPAPLLLPEKKTFDFDGLELSREPNEIEKLIGLKSLVSDLEAQSESLESSLLKYREALINQAVSLAKDLSEKEIYSLTLERNEKQAKIVKKSLIDSYEVGKVQIVREIAAQRSAKRAKGEKFPNAIEYKELLDEETAERLASLSDSVIAKILNEIQRRVIDIYTALKILNWDASTFFDELRKRLGGESSAFVSQLSRNSANAAVMRGRADQIAELDEGITEYSGILDKNICDQCKAWDGERSKTPEKDFPQVPNNNCLGGASCRCFWVQILD